MAVRTATKENRQAAAKGQKRAKKTCAPASAAHARHYGIKDSKASSDLSESLSTDVSARHFSRGGAAKSGAGYARRGAPAPPFAPLDPASA
ncbi:hypothetical protein I35_1107 [Burkholderia cenocepacia H111]|nr:uncharacterized protein BCN122_I0967 [Burkholderia cenocepacia]CDN59630.1 hypothetical protein I35_1107 [Burkholderia cenocepacia H111]